LQGISFVDAMLACDEGSTPQAARLRTCIDAAAPRLSHSGGARHLLAILPKAAAGTAVEETLASAIDPPPTTLRSHGSDRVFCHDVQELASSLVAAKLIAERDDFVQIASRLHTRVDVVWSGLPAVALAEAQLTTT